MGCSGGSPWGAARAYPSGMLAVSPRAGDTMQPGVCTDGGHVSTRVHVLGGCWAAHTQNQGCQAQHEAGAPVPSLRFPPLGLWGLRGWWLLLHLWLWPWRSTAVFPLRAPGMGTKAAGPGATWLNLSLPQRSQIPASGSPSAACVCRGGLCQPARPLLRYFGAVCPALVSATVEGGGGNV